MGRVRGKEVEAGADRRTGPGDGAGERIQAKKAQEVRVNKKAV